LFIFFYGLGGVALLDELEARNDISPKTLVDFKDSVLMLIADSDGDPQK
jgi:hypothetical protein